MKLIIQIPSYNEESTLAEAIKSLPGQIEGIREIEYLVIDDGSTDRTAEVAKEAGAVVVRHPVNLGLARAFMTGIETGLQRGADIIVNTDADNQYDAKCIKDLIHPILRGEADFVIGERPIESVESFSFIKKKLQRLGSRVVRILSGTEIKDAPSGFRAISRMAAQQLNVFSEYTYTLETIIQAGHKGIAIKSVPIRVNAVQRPSRLVKSISNYVRRSALTMLRIFMVYRPLKFFFAFGIISLAGGTGLGIRFLVYYILGEGGGKVQSLILAALLIGIGFLFFALALLSDLIAVNRKLLERMQVSMYRMEEKLDANTAGKDGNS